MRTSRRFPALLDSRLWFPDPGLADSEGLVAIGGDMSVARLLLAYRTGLFPWTDQPITWWSPDPRAIIEWDAFHESRSLSRLMRNCPFEITRDQAFQEVMEGCAAPAPGRMETWIEPEFLAAYERLHREGHAHSVECWLGGELVGGVYGVAVGGLFAGESMFHRTSNASKVALSHLVQHLRERGFRLLDVQMLTPVTIQMGAKNISRSDYLSRLREAVAARASF